MINRNLFREIPTKRIKPVDGMAVTAQVWDEAHEFHHERHRYHDLLRHGSGVVAGLEVIASDPADSSVYILPGVAVDPLGEMIVLSEPVAYDVGEVSGLMYLLLTFEESRPAPDEEDGPHYVHAQFGMEAALTLPDRPYVELARIRRRDRRAPVVDAGKAEYPDLNEIDLRFRKGLPRSGAGQREPASVAVCYAGGEVDAHQGHGAGNLARALRHAGHPVWMDDHVPLAPGLEAYTLLYLVGQQAFEFSQEEMNALYSFLQGGGTLLYEGCRRAQDVDDSPASVQPPADASVTELLESMGVQLSEMQSGHDLLIDPHLFAAPPPGFETEATGQVLVGGGVILSKCDFGCLWQGQRRGRAATREEIRTAMEWGENIVAFAARRRRESEGS